MDIEIQLLNKNAAAIPKLAKILHAELGKWFAVTTLHEIETWMYEWLNEDLPLAMVAFDHNTPVGLCSLQINDGIRPELKPWLGDLCVTTAYKNLGIGTMLVSAAKNKARELGFYKLYLFTPDPLIPGFYIRTGWQKIGVDIYNGHTVTVMEIFLGD